jgi:hypothetical protein
MRSLLTSVLLVILGWSPAFAAAADKRPALAGKYVLDPQPQGSRCLKVQGQLAAMLRKSYTCTTDPLVTAYGVRAAGICNKKQGEGGYLVFDKKKSCENQREMEASAKK